MGEEEEQGHHPFAVSIMNKGCRADVRRIHEVLESGWDIKKAETVLLGADVGNEEEQLVQERAAYAKPDHGSLATLEVSDSHPREWPNEIGSRPADLDVIMCDEEVQSDMDASQPEAYISKTRALISCAGGRWRRCGS